jgi:hypothetical protein
MEQKLKCKAGIGFDVNFYRFGNRKLKKGEFIYEPRNIILKRTDEIAEFVECKIVDVELNAFIGDLNFKTTIKCFNGWNRIGLGNHIGKTLDIKNVVFRIYRYDSMAFSMK